MDLKYIHYLETIAMVKNISAAARQLYISQPTLSQCLKKYEDDLGYPIFARTKQGLRLTREGEIFMDTALKMKNLERSMENQLNDTSHMVSGKVIFGVSAHRAPFLLPSILPEVRRQYPNITVEIVEGRTRELEYDLLVGRIDVGILIPPLQSRDIPHDIFLEEEIFLAVPKAYDTQQFAHMREGNMPWMSLDSLKNYPFLLHDSRNRLFEFTQELFAKESFTPKESSTFRSIATVSSLAAAGMGVTLLPETFVTANDQLDYYSIGPKGYFRPLALGYPPNFYRSHTTRMFSELVVRLLKEEHETFKGRYMERRYSHLPIYPFL